MVQIESHVTHTASHFETREHLRNELRHIHTPLIDINWAKITSIIDLLLFHCEGAFYLNVRLNYYRFLFVSYQVVIQWKCCSSTVRIWDVRCSAFLVVIEHQAIQVLLHPPMTLILMTLTLVLMMVVIVANFLPIVIVSLDVRPLRLLTLNQIHLLCQRSPLERTPVIPTW